VMCRRVRCADWQGLWGEMDQKWPFHMLAGPCWFDIKVVIGQPEDAN
jgi:hypothetical protein